MTQVLVETFVLSAICSGVVGYFVKGKSGLVTTLIVTTVIVVTVCFINVFW